MERCQLWISIPPSNMTHIPATQIQPIDGVMVDIWELDLIDELYPLQSLKPSKWSTLPQRRSLHAQGLLLKNDSSMQLKEFHCRSGEYTTFEISCAPGDKNQCLLDFWQVKESTVLNGEIRFNIDLQVNQTN